MGYYARGSLQFAQSENPGGRYEVAMVEATGTETFRTAWSGVCMEELERGLLLGLCNATNNR
jgi:hypothetical protein